MKTYVITLDSTVSVLDSTYNVCEVFEVDANSEDEAINIAKKEAYKNTKLVEVNEYDGKTGEATAVSHRVFNNGKWSVWENNKLKYDFSKSMKFSEIYRARKYTHQNFSSADKLLAEAHSLVNDGYNKLLEASRVIHKIPGKSKQYWDSLSDIIMILSTLVDKNITE